MYAQLLSAGEGIMPLSLHCTSGHLPGGTGNCLNGYVPHIGTCKFGKQT